MKILLATKNKAKIKYYGHKLKQQGIDIITLNELDIECNVNEIGKDPIENAIIKAVEYNKISKIPTIAIDDGLFFESIPEEIQPGTNVRRINGKRLNDNEMLDYYIEIVNKYGQYGKLNGYFQKGIAIVDDKDIYSFDCKINRYFVNRKSEIIDEGYPLESMQIIMPLNKFSSELTEEEEKEITYNEHKEIFDFIIDTINNLERKINKKGKIE